MNEQVKNQVTTTTATTEVAPGVDEAPMAVYPLNSSAKLDQEPNPFEKSFSGATIEDKKLILPPVASITSPAPPHPSTAAAAAAATGNNSVIRGGILPKEVTNQFTWETLRTGPLSPSMLQGPIHSEEYYSSTATLNVPTSTRSSFSSNYPIKVEQKTSTRSRQSSTASLNNSRKRSNSQTLTAEDNMSLHSQEEESAAVTTTRTRRRSTKSNTSTNNDDKDDEKRKNFLERNRIAALKCRQRKKQWLNNLQAKVEFLSSDNERLQLQSESLKEEIVNLKTLLLAHKDCPVAQANGFNTNSIQKGIPSLSSSDLLRQNSMGYQQSPSNYNSRHNSISSTSTNPSYQRTSMPSMIAGGGGSSGIIRF